MKTKTIPSLLIAAAAVLSGAQASAAALLSYSAPAGTAVTDYSADGLLSFDLDLGSVSSVTMNFGLGAGDRLAPLAFNAIIRNLTGQGLESLRFTLSQGGFSSVGSVTRNFGGSTSFTGQGEGSVLLEFSPAEYLDLEIGNALGSTVGAADWTLDEAVLAADRITITVSANVPEPGSYGLVALGLGLLALQRRRSRGR
ncbi:PEP-CTERM sorting domain-containing protein [Roseateles sp.]|jgi:hypothetical protein|uniref:PEP-CTERM sorting domain-containing protein n=1 Tax=Roseateles sp. TaxID=1971397 RepID=UPI0037CC1080